MFSFVRTNPLFASENFPCNIKEPMDKLNFDLSYISPVQSSFTLKAVPDREFRLRPVALSDQQWMDKTFGDKLQSVFKMGKVVEMSRIVFHQLVPEDQAFFAQQEITFTDEHGNSQKEKLGGVKMLQTLIMGPQETANVIMALVEAIGVSKPMLDELEKQELKKKVEPPPIGPTSSTSLESNTDGQANKS